MAVKVVKHPDTAPCPDHDRSLLQRIARGEHSALVELIKTYQPSIERYISCHLYDEQLRQDCLQDVLLTVLERASTFQGTSSIKTWLLGIARFKIYHLVRKKKKHQNLQRSLTELGQHAGWGVVNSEARYALKHTLHTLEHMPALMREIIVLRDIEGLSTRDTAHVLGISEAASKSRLHRARLELMARLHKEECS